MTAFTELLEEVLEWVLSTGARNHMLVYHPELAKWREVNDFITLDYETRTNDGGRYPGQTYFYDKELDTQDSVRSYFVTSHWRWALNVEWAASLEFAQKFHPLYALDGYIYGCPTDQIAWMRTTLGIEAIDGFTMMPSLATDLYEPTPWYIVMNESDAVVVRVAMDNSNEDQKKKKKKKR